MNLRTVTLSATGYTDITLGSLAWVDGARTGYTLEDAEFSPADREVSQDKLPLVPGGSVTPGRLGIRTVTLRGTVAAATAEAARVLAQELVALTGDHGIDPVTIGYDNGTAPVTLTGYLTGRVELAATGGPLLSYAVEFACPDPVAKAVTEQGAVLTGSPGVTVVNDGNADVWPRFTLALTGDPTQVKVGHYGKGMYLHFKDLPAGTVLEVDLTPGYETAELDGDSVLGLLDYTSRWFPISPGTQQVYAYIPAGVGSVGGTVYWFDGWAY